MQCRDFLVQLTQQPGRFRSQGELIEDHYYDRSNDLLIQTVNPPNASNIIGRRRRSN